MTQHLIDQVITILEARSKRLAALDEAMHDVRVTLRGLTITAVLTHPASGSTSGDVLGAIRRLVAIVDTGDINAV